MPSSAPAVSPRIADNYVIEIGAWNSYITWWDQPWWAEQM